MLAQNVDIARHAVLREVACGKAHAFDHFGAKIAAAVKCGAVGRDAHFLAKKFKEHVIDDNKRRDVGAAFAHHHHLFKKVIFLNRKFNVNRTDLFTRARDNDFFDAALDFDTAPIA